MPASAEQTINAVNKSYLLTPFKATKLVTFHPTSPKLPLSQRHLSRILHSLPKNPVCWKQRTDIATMSKVPKDYLSTKTLAYPTTTLYDMHDLL